MKIVAKDFVDHLLVVNVNDRYTCEQALNHPWLKVLIFFFLTKLFLHTFLHSQISLFFSEQTESRSKDKQAPDWKQDEDLPLQ